MNAAIVFFDVMSFVGFSIAFVLGLTFRVRSPLITPAVRRVFAAAMMLYVLVGVSNVLQHTGVTPQFDRYEDFLEILFLPAMAWVASAVYLNRQIEVQRSLARTMTSQNALLLSIMDTVPSGVIVVDPAGGVSFSNSGAERILGLKSDSFGTLHLTPSWTLRNPMTGTAVTLADLVSAGEIERRPFVAEWPDRQATSLMLSATPMETIDGSPGGSVIAFEDVTRRQRRSKLDASHGEPCATPAS